MTIIPRKLLGDCRQTLLQVTEKSVHCCVTSIPYWGLRNYLPKGHPLKGLEIGCEPTFELYLENIVEAFRAVWRVLRDDGTLWLNVGDSYVGGGNGGGGSFACDGIRVAKPGTNKNVPSRNGSRGAEGGLKPKDLLMMPARVAMALQADGWYLRSQIPWIKRNAMPESCTDRPASAIEYIYLLSKSKDYFYDRYAVMMPVSAATNPRLSQNVTAQLGSARANGGAKTNGRMKAVGQSLGLNPKACKNEQSGDRTKDGFNDRWKNKQNESFTEAISGQVVSARNRRNTDWFMQSFQGLLTDEAGDPLAMVVNLKGTTIQHFASYPTKLVEPCIKAGTSERGCCAVCGAPWERELTSATGGATGKGFHDHADDDAKGQKQAKLGGNEWKTYQPAQSAGFRPTCECHGKLVRGKVTIPARVPKEVATENWGADSNGEYLGKSTKEHSAHGVQDASDVKARIIRNATEERQVDGWIYESDLPLDQHPVRPCVVLDPFSGTSTTGEVATGLGRDSIMCELNEDYFRAARVRDSQGGLALL